MAKLLWLCSTLLLAIIFNNNVCNGFNLDTVNYVRFQKPQRENSMFGFSVALHEERERSW